MDLSTGDAFSRAFPLNPDTINAPFQLPPEPTMIPTLAFTSPPVNTMNRTNASAEVITGAYGTDTVSLTGTNNVMPVSAQDNDEDMSSTINIGTEPTVDPTVEPTAPPLVANPPLVIS